jgi:hypothetical protein
VDHLFLLIGTNPLPNYVAAKLLARDPATTTLWLVHSRDTASARDMLEHELREEEFQHFQSVQVDESSPANVRKEVTRCATGLAGLVGLNYTGGTKAMAVHAYRALDAIRELRVQYSYLDARTLTMQLEGHAIPTGKTITDVVQRVPVKIEKILALHGLTRLVNQMSRQARWPAVVEALIQIYARKDQVEQWLTWRKAHLRKKDGNFITDMGTLSTDDLPFESLRVAFRVEYPLEQEPIPFARIVALDPFPKADDLPRWLDGTWLEHHVFIQLESLRAQAGLADLALSLNPALTDGTKPPEFEFDVAATRGYQLFACSVTTVSNASSCREKLVEALVRAEQLGGSEARVALICYVDNPEQLHRQVSKLFHQSRSRVFGPRHIGKLGEHLADWIADVRRYQE